MESSPPNHSELDMNDVIDQYHKKVYSFNEILETTKNGITFKIFRHKQFVKEKPNNDSIITFGISTLESILRMRENEERPLSDDVFPRITAYFGSISPYNYVQVVALENTCSTSNFICWANGGGLITGTALMDGEFKKFSVLEGYTHSTYGTFLKDMQGNVLIFLLLFGTNLRYLFSPNSHNQCAYGTTIGDLSLPTSH